jgi:nitrogen regulatory protein P-II 1
VSDFRITPVEVLVVLLCLALIAVLILPALLISREESRSVTCQSHQVQLVLAIRDPSNPLSIVDPMQWPQLLAARLSDGSIIEHCPSDDRQPPAVASYGINPILESLRRAPLEALNIREVKGYGRQKSYLDEYGDTEYSHAFLPKVEITLWVDDSRAEEVVRKLIDVARTGRIGDGKIMVLPSEEIPMVDSMTRTNKSPE